MSYKLCNACEHSGVVHQMKEEYLQTWIAGTQPDVIKYTCPFCGKVEGKIDTHGDSIEEAARVNLCANILGLPADLVEVGGGIIAPHASTYGAV